PGRGTAEGIRLADPGDELGIALEASGGRRRERDRAGQEPDRRAAIDTLLGNGGALALHHEHTKIVVADGAATCAAVAEESGFWLRRRRLAYAAEASRDRPGAGFPCGAGGVGRARFEIRE